MQSFLEILLANRQQHFNIYSVARVVMIPLQTIPQRGTSVDVCRGIIATLRFQRAKNSRVYPVHGSKLLNVSSLHWQEMKTTLGSQHLPFPY